MHTGCACCFSFHVRKSSEVIGISADTFASSAEHYR